MIPDPYQQTNSSEAIAQPEPPPKTKLKPAPDLSRWHQMTLTQRAQLCKRSGKSYQQLAKKAGPAPARRRKPLYSGVTGGREYTLVHGSQRI